MSTFWSAWIIVLILGNIFACYWLIRWATKPVPGEAAEGDVTGHSWDGLEEFNNPLPRWWLYLFYGTIVFGLIYLTLYPGLGAYKGLLGWTSHNQWDKEMAQAEKTYGPIFKKYAAMDIPTLAKDPKANEMGRSLFLNYCAQCHGSDAGGGPHFPNLTDNDWLWGGEPETIEKTILDGRQGIMPARGGAPIDDEGVKDVAQYVLSLSGRKHDAARAERGKKTFDTICMACHTPAGTGNHAMGAPNLTDKIWLHGSTLQSIEKTIREGRHNVMPAHRDFLGTDKVHLLAAYVYSLSHK